MPIIITVVTARLFQFEFQEHGASNTTYSLFGGVSTGNPSILIATSSSQNFSYLPGSDWLVARADDWGRWGSEVMPRQILRAPGCGQFFNPTLAVASGNVTLSVASDTVVRITMYQNSFGLVNGSVQSTNFVLGSTDVLVTSGSTVAWSLVCSAQNNLSGGPGFTNQIQLSIGVAIV